MEKDKELRSTNFFITYPHDELITTAISELCSLRIIWGGNDTVRNIRKLPLNPHAGERVFPTKYSYTLINGETYANSPSNNKAQIASLFYRDLFPFDPVSYTHLTLPTNREV